MIKANKVKGIDDRILKFYNHICKTNKKMIIENKGLSAVCLLMKKDGSVICMALLFKDGREKEIMREYIKDLILKQEGLGYIFVCDTKMTVMNTDKKKNISPKVYDCIMTNLYTAQKKKTHFIFYEEHGDKKIIVKTPKSVAKGMLHVNRKEAQDMWDIWGTEVDENKNIDAYNQFKKENPQLFSGVDGINEKREVN